MRTARLMATATLAIAGMLALAGCSGSSDSGESASASGAAPAGTTQVSMVLWPGPEGEAMQKVVDDYNANQGKTDGVEVKQVLLSRSDTFSKEATLMKAGSNEYDIYFTASYLIAQHAPYLSAIEGLDASKFLKTSVESLQVDGQQMGLPLDTSLHFMYYRQDLVDAMAADAATYSKIAKEVLGKDLQPNTDPSTWTWDDALGTAAYYTQQYNPNSPTKYGYALPAKNLLYNTMIWNDVLWGLGGNWLDASGQPAINTEVGKAAIDVYATIYGKGLTSPDSSQWEYAETNAALTSGNAMMALQWNAAYGELSTTGDTNGKIGIAPPPGTGPRTHVHALAVGLNKDSANADAARKWLAYLGTEDAMKKYAAAGGVPSMPSVLEGMVDQNASFANLIEYANEFGFSEPKVAREFDMYASLAETLSPAWIAQVPAEEAAVAANEAMAGLLQ